MGLPSHLPRRRRSRGPMEQAGERDGGRVANLFFPNEQPEA
jgi:hypothetical protein